MPDTRLARRVAMRGDPVRLPEAPDDPPQLIGSACPECKARYAGKRVICLDCGYRGLHPALLSPTGALWTFTIVHQKPPGSIMDVPYVIAQMQLDDGPIVSSVLVDTPVESVRIGLPLEITLVPAGRDEDGNEVVSHAFRPRREAA
jgi:uncharacterized OB-fold protein